MSGRATMVDVRCRPWLLSMTIFLYATCLGASCSAETVENGFRRDPIPVDISVAVEVLREGLSEARRHEFGALSEEEFLVRERFGIGRWIREQWLQEGSPLSEFFADHDVMSAEGSSRMLLSALWRRLNDRPIDFESMIASMRRLSAETELPADMTCPRVPGKSMKSLHRELSRTETGEPRVEHFAYCSADKTYWKFHIDEGWTLATEAEALFLTKNYPSLESQQDEE